MNEDAVSKMSEPQPLGPVAAFTLVDQFGARVTAADYAGNLLLVYFGFTHCKVVCPRSLAKLSDVLAEIGPRGDPIVALYVTVDPERDTPERMREYVEANYPRFVGLTGTRAQIDAAKSAFRVFAARRATDEGAADYDVPHTAIAYLMAPDGRYLDHFADSVEKADIVKRVVARLQDHPPAA